MLLLLLLLCLLLLLLFLVGCICIICIISIRTILKLLLLYELQYEGIVVVVFALNGRKKLVWRLMNIRVNIMTRVGD